MQQFQQNQIRSNDTEIESIRIVHNNVKSFWSKHEKEFTQWWSGLANKDKLAFLLDVSPISPDLGFKPVPFDITHHIVPEMVPKALYDLSALFKEFTFAGEADAATPAIHKLGWARDPVEDCSLEIVAVAQLAFLRSQIRKGLLLDKRNEYPNQFVALIGEPLGKRIQKTKKPPAGVDRNKFMESQRRLSEYREAGVWCYVEEWNLLKQRLYIIVNALGIIADEFKSENLGKQSSGMKTVKANVGCTACGKLQSTSGAVMHVSNYFLLQQ
ncbi:hypothetical protein BDR26DRAFT_863771 [Obelidium mucronatum]|nr:hypothetical protein BDR26DRAFT_863771 [Obelidium mucronatum]